MSKIKKLNDFVDQFPLEDILETAEMVALVLPIPYMPTIIKTLKMMVKYKPLTQKTLGVARAITNPKEAKKEDACATFNRLWDIAMEDGIITEDEKAFLRVSAKDAGIPNDVFEKMVASKSNNY